jgi:hypothetical protein
MTSPALSSRGAIDGDRDKNGRRLSPASNYRIATATSVSIGVTDALEMDEQRKRRWRPLLLDEGSSVSASSRPAAHC